MSRRPIPRPPPISNNSPIAPDSDSLASDSGGTTADGDRLADTQSLSPSVTDYPVYWGRRYHRYREGSYVFPNDESESERLDHLHDIFSNYFERRLFNAPIDPETCQQVLDIGTGTGIWAVELAESGRLPYAQITGTDLSAIQPELVPEEVSFEIQDCSDSDWMRPLASLDLIHARHMAGSLARYQDFIKTARKYLRPGTGYLELHEVHPQPKCDDATMPEDWKFLEWEENISYASTRRLRPPRPTRVAHKLEEWLKRSGFEDVISMEYKVPLGSWPKDHRMKEIGIQYAANWSDGLPGFSYKLLGAEGLGWSRDEIELNLLEVRRSLAQREVHAYMAYYIVFGRRPTAREERERMERQARGEED
jgi:SAM-dependent methyltransferase